MLANELTQTIAPVLLLEREAELAALEAMLGAARRATAGSLSSRAAPGSGRRGFWPRRARLPRRPSSRF